eukprot:IDg10378t1
MSHRRNSITACEGCAREGTLVSGTATSRPITFRAPRSASTSQRRRPTNPELPVTIAVSPVKSEGSGGVAIAAFGAVGFFGRASSASRLTNQGWVEKMQLDPLGKCLLTEMGQLSTLAGVLTLRPTHVIVRFTLRPMSYSFGMK